jgi:hypothetical protein
MDLVEGQSPINWPINPRSERDRVSSERDRVTFIGCSGGRSISGISSNFLTKLRAFETVDFLLQASTRRRKEAEGEGGGGGSPPWAAMAAHSRTLT